MSNVNFWNETATLHINDIPCAVRKEIILARGFQDDVERTYDNFANKEVRAVLVQLFDLIFTETVFTKKPYYTKYYMWDRTTDGWELLTNGKNKLFERDIETVVVTLEYAVRSSEVSMKKLFDYPADLVVEYLKERGITSCPLRPE
jgi:hypothetical protein